MSSRPVALIAFYHNNHLTDTLSYCASRNFDVCDFKMFNLEFIAFFDEIQFLICLGWIDVQQFTVESYVF